MSDTTFIRVPFATSGDRTAIPFVVEGDGSISWPQGFGPKYALDPTDPDALLVPREETNQYIYDLSANIRAWQLQGFPQWVAASQNGGVAVQYPLSAVVVHNGGAGTTWVQYRSKIVGATLEPGVGGGWAAQWDVVVAPAGTPLYANNNLSDVANAATARTNLGLGTMATQAAGSYLTVAAPSYTGGMTGTGGLFVTGPTTGNVNTVGALNVDWSVADFHVKALAANGAITFSGVVAARGAAIALRLTISSSAVPTWPAAVQWPNGAVPTFSNGVHVIAFVTFDGGTTIQGIIGGRNFA